MFLTSIRPIASDWDWQQEGECRKYDPETFFLEPLLRGSAKQKKIVAAKKICVPCPVKDKCLNHALVIPEDYGVWGGLSEEEREILRARSQD